MPSNFSVPQPPFDPDVLTDDEDALTDIDLEEVLDLPGKALDDLGAGSIAICSSSITASLRPIASAM